MSIRTDKRTTWLGQLCLLNEIGHAGVGVIYGTKTWEYSHDSHANNTNAGHSLLNGKDAMWGTKKRKWFTNAP